MAAGTILRATVIGREPGGQTVLRTQYGALAIKTPAALPLGGTVMLQLQQTGAQLQVAILSVDGGTNPGAAVAPRPHLPAPPLAAPPPTTAAPGNALLMLTGKWEALAEALAALGRSSDQPASHRLADVVPRPGADLAARLVHLIDALRGDLAAWIGRDTVRAIAAAAGEGLAGRLGEDFARLARLGAAEPGDWRFLPIPLFHAGVLGQLRLFARHRQPATGDGEEDPGTRILIDVELPRLGQVQLDALVQPHRFDLILRSRAVLPDPWRAGIAAIFDDAREIGRLEGDLAFLVVRDFAAPPIGATGADTRGVTA
jgi:hypothetical protein